MNFSSINSKPNNSSDYSAYSENFVVYEGFNDRGYKVGTTGNTILSDQVLPLSLIATDYSNKLKTVNQNYYDLSSNISSIKTIQNDISGNSYYDYNTPFVLEKPKTLLDGLVYDNNLLTVQENAMYVLGTIAAATLIVFAIVIGKE
uniref:Uncharacterized protein n=1 Tax=viral metagenome TaxID=1070528 RepID=A0A6C0L933_9ZZZZ